MMKPQELDALVKEALTHAKAGKSSVALRLLYNIEYRDKVRWLDFPPHFRPSDPDDFVCHEG